MKCKTFWEYDSDKLEQSINDWLETQRNITIEHTNSLVNSNMNVSHDRFHFIIFYSTRKDKLERIEQNNDE